MPDLLDFTAVKIYTLTINAMGFQFGIAKKFTDKDVGNILIVKENQAEPKEQVE